MADKGGLQLLPETRKRIEVRTPGENRFLTVGVLFLFIVAGIQFGLTMYIDSLNNEVVGLNGEIEALENQRDKKAEANLVDLSKQAGLITGLLSNHIFISQAYRRISDLTQTDTELLNLSFSVLEQRVDLRGNSPSYTSLARQLAALLNDPGIKDVQLGKVSVSNAGTVDFTMNITIDADKFFKKQ